LSISTNGGGVSGLVVDANPLISALRRGKAMRVFVSRRFRFYTTIRTIWQAQRYIPEIAREL
jgi:hypothetical protein